jgi:hypothetical protein
MYVSNYQLLQYICLDLTFDKLSIRLSVLIINFKINNHCTFFRNHLIYTLDCLSFIFSFSLFSFFVYLSNWFRINLITYFLLLLNNSISISLVTITSIYFVFESPGNILQSYFNNFIIGGKCTKCVSRKL